MAERSASQTKETRLSADVEPFVPKQQVVTLRWSESSSASLPRYLTTCYPFVQDPYVDGQHLREPENVCSKFSQNYRELNTSYPVMSSHLPVDYSPYYSYKQSSDSSLNPLAQTSLHSEAEDIYSSKYKYNSSSRGNKKKQQRAPQDSEKDRSLMGQSSKEARSKKELKKQGQNINELPERDEQLQRPDVFMDNITKNGNKQVNKYQHNKSKPLQKNELEPTTDNTSKVASGDSPKEPSAAIQPSPGFRQSQESSKVCKQSAKVWLADDTTNMVKASQSSGISMNSEKCTVSDSAIITSSVALSFLPVSSTATPPVLSWAKIVSQTPKKPVLISVPPKAQAHNNAQRNEDETKLKEASVKVKKKKKKKKPKESNETSKQIESKITAQEPPRLEDDEEFPDLASAISTSDKTANAGQSKFSAYNQVVKKQFEVSVDEELGLHETSLHDPGDGSIYLDQKTIQIMRKESVQENRTTSPLKNSMEVPKKSGKKSKIPMQLDFGNMLTVLEQKQQEKSSKHTPKPIVFAVGGALPLVPKEPTSTSKRLPQSSRQEKVPHNPLDSSALLIKRGKQREVPKAKKPTSLKKIILKEREERKQQRLLEEKGLIPSSCNIISAPESQTLTLDQNVIVNTNKEMAELNDSTEDLSNSAPSSPCQDLQPLSDVPKNPEEIWTKNILPNPSHQKIHSRRFREYCSQVLSKEVDNFVTDLLKELVRFQDRLYQKDPIKAKKKRRIVMGLREVLKHLKLKRLKCVIISPNCERIKSKGGLDEALYTIIEVAREQEIPFVFALNRRALGRCVNKAVPVSVVGIFSYDGAENQFHQMVELTEEARKVYQEMLNSLEQELQADKGNSLEPLCNLSETIALNNMTSQSFTEASEPEYVTTWRNLLKRQCNPNLSDTENTQTSEILHSDSEEETSDSVQDFPKSILDLECQAAIR
ncbi:selenocysteine insertion sequence-binding protein 2 isoform X2 [Narcine bancroftii]|uniref:selenocysteine insertion sequence-binding protein 2 isoform X2 n=1 Tax=Narcine bancroftii TaxID=1343680 RepID=UPI0038315429